MALRASPCSQLGRTIEGRDEVGEALSLDENMVFEKPLSRFALTGSDCVNDGLVFIQRVRDTAASSKLQAAVRLQPIMKLTGLLRQEGIPASLVDDMVKALVGVVVGVRISPSSLAGAVLMGLQKLLLRRFVDPAGRQGAA
jgi:hypothetical protein